MLITISTTETSTEKNGEEYCESSDMISNKDACLQSSCCVWNTGEYGGDWYGEWRCWSAIGKNVCSDMEGRGLLVWDDEPEP